MPIQRTFLWLSAVFVLCAAAGSASATTNFFTPKSGAAFRGSDPTLKHVHGSIVATHTNIQQATSASVSLGHAAGGTNGFTVYGSNPNQLRFVCFVNVRSDANTTTTSFGANSSSASLSVFVQTSLPAGSYFYSLTCRLPPGASIVGVKPDH